MTPDPRYDVTGNIGAQVGDQNVLNVNLPPAPTPVEWPVRVGVLPLVADRYQHRAAEDELVEVLESGDVAVLVGAERAAGVVLSGLGGVGKSQLAAWYAQTVWRDESVDLVVWISAASRSTVLSGYADAADNLLPTTTQQPSDDKAKALLTWLSTTPRRWLIVLDDVQDPHDLRDLWPPHTPSGKVVVTTRRRDVALVRGDRRMIDVGVFTAEESLSYLTAKLTGDIESLRGLAADLGHLPLALAQAAAFIMDKPLLTVPAYRERLADRRKKLAQVMPNETELSDEHRATVAATWSLSIDRANDLPPQGLARPLLEIISLLDPASVPTTVFTSTPVVDYLDTLVEPNVDNDAVSDALGCLYRLSLITLDREQPARTVQSHALLQRVVRDTLTPEQIARLAHIAADALLEIWPKIDTTNSVTPALRSAAEILHTTTHPALWQPHSHRLLVRAGRSLVEAGLVTAAMTYHQHLHDQAHDQFGPNHPDTLRIRNNLAQSRAEAGDHAAAITELEQLLTNHLRVLGPNHPTTLVIRNNLASSRGRIGDHAAAIAEFEQLLIDRLRVLGPDHPDTLRTRSNLASSRAVAGDHAAAITEFEQLLTDQLRVLSPNHPNTLVTRGNLASSRGDIGDHAAAVTELEQLLTDQLRVLSPNHPNTLVTRDKLVYWRAQSTSGGPPLK